MGAAKEHRDVRAIRAIIDRDTVKQDPLVFENNRLEIQNEQLKAHVASLENDLAKAKRLITVLSISKRMMYEKLQAMQDTCCEVKRSFLASKSYAHAYGMMILANRLGLK